MECGGIEDGAAFCGAGIGLAVGAAAGKGLGCDGGVCGPGDIGAGGAGADLFCGIGGFELVAAAAVLGDEGAAGGMVYGFTF